MIINYLDLIWDIAEKNKGKQIDKKTEKQFNKLLEWMKNDKCEV